jgi:fused signal recognition particle receptor
MAMKWFKKKNKKERPENQPDLEPEADREFEPESIEPTADRQAETDEGPSGPESVAAIEAARTPEGLAEAQAGPAGPDQHQAAKAKKGLFGRLRRGLSKTREILTTDIEDLFTRRGAIDDDLLEELEELLITSDIGVHTAMALMDRISVRSGSIKNAAELKSALKEEVLALLDGAAAREPAPAQQTRPYVIMVVGVNGVGKTTTIGKLAAKYTRSGQNVLIVAADTFRAAAIEQLGIWAERANADFVKQKDGADPAAVAFDGVQAACSRNTDIVLVDTAGRLHTKVNLMEELKKIKRSISKNIANAPHEIMLVLDATTGQNAISQAQLFNEALEIHSLALTKLDGTAKGGIVVSICKSLNIPLKYVGVGESIDDLQAFEPVRFVDALF